MEKLILNDGTEIEIKAGAGLRHITTEVSGYSTLEDLAEILTKENLKKVQFESDRLVSGEYENMILCEPHFTATERVDHLDVTFGLRELTAQEKQQESAERAASYLTDAQALTVKELYPIFEELAAAGFKAEKQGYRFRYENDLYKTAQDNITFLAQYKPGAGTESLYTRIDEGHAGTVEDPIPAATNMEYEYGKHYSEDGKTYICKRGGVPDPESMYGQKVTLQYLPSQLIGQYFELVG